MIKNPPSVTIEEAGNGRVTVRLTPDEAQILINLIDIAIKARGLEAAEAGFILAKRISEAKSE
jgi:hypothetical protein